MINKPIRQIFYWQDGEAGKREMMNKDEALRMTYSGLLLKDGEKDGKSLLLREEEAAMRRGSMPRGTIEKSPVLQRKLNN